MTEISYAILESDTGAFVIQRWHEGGWLRRGYWQPIGVKHTEQEAVDCMKHIYSASKKPKPPRYFSWCGEEIHDGLAATLREQS